MRYVGFLSWLGVLATVDMDLPVFYQAPMDSRPRRVHCKREGDKVRVTPQDRDTDPFLADETYLQHFKREDV